MAFRSLLSIAKGQRKGPHLYSICRNHNNNMRDFELLEEQSIGIAWVFDSEKREEDRINDCGNAAPNEYYESLSHCVRNSGDKKN